MGPIIDHVNSEYMSDNRMTNLIRRTQSDNILNPPRPEGIIDYVNANTNDNRPENIRVLFL